MTLLEVTFFGNGDKIKIHWTLIINQIFDFDKEEILFLHKVFQGCIYCFKQEIVHNQSKSFSLVVVITWRLIAG